MNKISFNLNRNLKKKIEKLFNKVSSKQKMKFFFI